MSRSQPPVYKNAKKWNKEQFKPVNLGGKERHCDEVTSLRDTNLQLLLYGKYNLICYDGMDRSLT
jgi:hypothetical protein